MSFFNFKTRGIIDGIVRRPDPVLNPIQDIAKTIETIDAIITDQTVEGKKEGYADAESEYKPIYADLKEEYEKLISDISSRRKELDIKSEKGLAELELLKEEKESLKNELNRRADRASRVFNVSSARILSSLASGSSAFFSSSFVWDYDLRDSIIEKKKKERLQARKEGYIEAKTLYEEKIDQLKAHYNRTKEDADVKLRDYADHISALLEDVEDLRFQIADLRIAMRG